MTLLSDSKPKKPKGACLVSQFVHQRPVKLQVFLVNLDVEIAVVLNLVVQRDLFWPESCPQADFPQTAHPATRARAITLMTSYTTFTCATSSCAVQSAKHQTSQHVDIAYLVSGADTNTPV